MARLKSFEGVLSQANTFMKGAKARSHEHLASTPMKKVYEEGSEDNKTDNVDSVSTEKIEQNVQESLTIEKTTDEITKANTQMNNHILEVSDV